MRILFAMLLIILASCHHDVINREEKKVLLFTNPTTKDASYKKAIQVSLEKASDKAEFKLEIRDNFDIFSEDSLVEYGAVVLLNLPEADLQSWQKTALERYLQSGGGLLIIDSLKNNTSQLVLVPKYAG